MGFLSIMSGFGINDLSILHSIWWWKHWPIWCCIRTTLSTIQNCQYIPEESISVDIFLWDKSSKLDIYINGTCNIFSVQIIPRPIFTGESIVAWDESFIPVSSPIRQVPQNITKKRFSRRNSCIFLTKWWPSLELGKPFACFENDIIGRKS